MNEKSSVDKRTGAIAILSKVKKNIKKVNNSMIFYPSVFVLLSLILGIYMVSSTNTAIESVSEKIQVLKIPSCWRELVARACLNIYNQIFLLLYLQS